MQATFLLHNVINKTQLKFNKDLQLKSATPPQQNRINKDGYKKIDSQFYNSLYFDFAQDKIIFFPALFHAPEKKQS